MYRVGVSPDETNCFQATFNFLNEGQKQTRNALGRIIGNLSAIIDDRDTLVKSLRVTRHIIAICLSSHGKHSALDRIDKHWEVAVSFLEGIQIIKALETIFPEPQLTNKATLSQKSSKNDRFKDVSRQATSVLFCVADLAGGVLWMLSLKIPILGPYSKVVHVVAFVAQIADGASLAGFFTDGLHVIAQLQSCKGGVESRVQILKLAEDVTAAVSLIAGFAAATSVATGFGVLSLSIGIGSFVYGRNASSVRPKD